MPGRVLCTFRCFGRWAAFWHVQCTMPMTFQFEGATFAVPTAYPPVLILPPAYALGDRGKRGKVQQQT